MSIPEQRPEHPEHALSSKAFRLLGDLVWPLSWPGYSSLVELANVHFRHAATFLIQVINSVFPGNAQALRGTVYEDTFI